MHKSHRIVNSDKSFTEFCEFVFELYTEHKYLTFEWRIGRDRSLSQNALFHVWLAEYAAYLLKIPKKEVTPGIIAGTKKIVKTKFYLATSESFMIQREINPWIPEDVETGFTSSGDWKSGEMFMVLEWLQLQAANDGLILESKGEHAKIKRATSHI